MRLIDADAFIDDVMERYCKSCDKRRGIKNGKYRIIYEIGEAPCRACSVDDMKDDVDNFQTIDAVPVVRCKDCKHRDPEDHGCDCAGHEMLKGGFIPMPDDWFCADGERREDADRSD